MSQAARQIEREGRAGVRRVEPTAQLAVPRLVSIHRDRHPVIANEIGKPRDFAGKV